MLALFLGCSADLRPEVASCLFPVLRTKNHTHTHTRNTKHTIIGLLCVGEEGLLSMSDDGKERGSLCLLTPINYQSVRVSQFVCMCVSV